jgi:ELWxxDGT repeat protein
LTTKKFFIESEAITGRELWVTDGTAENTKMVKNIAETWLDSNPIILGYLNSKAIFTASDNYLDVDGETALDNHGNELWISDGSESGTTLLKDICPGTCSAIFNSSTTMQIGSLLYFVADDGVHGYELWSTDGTTSGTKMIKDINLSGSTTFENFFNFNNKLAFIADDGIHGKEIWLSDSTEIGTSMLKEITVGSTTDPEIYGFFPFKNNLVFMAKDAVHGRELWISDGTSAGTNFLYDVNPGVADSILNSVVEIGNKFYFLAYNNIGRYDFYSSDGVTVTKLSSMNDNWVPSSLFVANNKVIFTSYKNSGEKELYSYTEGDPSVTLIELIPGASGLSNDSSLVVVNNKVMFTGQDSSNEYMFVSDGTIAGTSKFIIDGSGSYSDYDLVSYNNKVYWLHSIGTSYEIWASDGTLAGTHAVLTQATMNNSYPTKLDIVDGKYYLYADNYSDGNHAYWAIDMATEIAVKIATFLGNLAA